MSGFRQLPLPRQMVLVIGFVSALGLLITSTTMFGLTWLQFRQRFERNLATLAGILAGQTKAPLAFADKKATDELLSALQAEPQVLCVYLQTPDGEIFARHGAPHLPDELARFPASSGLRYWNGEVFLTEPILLDGKVAGRLLVRADYRADWRKMLAAYGMTLAVVLGGTLGMVLLLSARLQRLISAPILQLADTAQRIALRKDYSVRAEAAGQVEVDLLTRAFNQMLDQIQARDAALQRAHGQLEFRVEERTRELVQSLSVLQATLESTADGILVVDREQRVTHYNAQFGQIWRIPESILASKDDRRLLAHMLDHLEDPDGFLCQFNAFYAKPEAENHDLLRFKDGRVVEWLSLPQRVGEASVGRVWSFQDVTERKRGEQALRDSEARFRAICQSARDAIIMMDSQGRVSLWNVAAEQIFGYSHEEILGQNLHQTIAPERFQAAHQQAFSAFQRTGHGPAVGRTLELTGRRENGEEFPVELALSAVELNGAWHAIGLARDITERKRAEAEHAALQMQITQAQKLESIGRLAAGIAHEINTPTQFIGDNTRFLQDAFGDLAKLLAAQATLLDAARQNAVTPELLAQTDAAVQQADLDYLQAEIPKAIEQSLEGVSRVAKIVRAMKEFSHPGSAEKTAVNLNQALESTLTVCRNEWKYVAEWSSNSTLTCPPCPVCRANLTRCSST